MHLHGLRQKLNRRVVDDMPNQVDRLHAIGAMVVGLTGVGDEPAILGAEPPAPLPVARQINFEVHVKRSIPHCNW